MPLRDSGVPSWLYVPGLRDLAGADGTLRLPEDESHYVVHVCRAHAGEHLVATDGAGTVADLMLERAEAKAVARVVAIRTVARPCEAWVLCGAPEGARADWLVEKLAELGISRLQPVECDRACWRGARLGRWLKLAVAAVRQSRSAWLLEVLGPVPLRLALETLPASAARWLASPEAPAARGSSPPAAVSVLAVGPSPGFSAPEVALLRARDFEPVCLAKSRLRTETAAIAWAAQWSGSIGVGLDAPHPRP